LSVKIDDVGLISKDEESDKDMVHEIRSITKISSGAKRKLVEHRVTSASGSVLKDSGRETSRISLEGEIVGDRARIA
jgi:hypothetical protein